MKCRKLIALLITAVFLLTTAVPALANNGGSVLRPIKMDDDHPWQDDNQNGPEPQVQLTSIPVVIGPVITIIKMDLLELIWKKFRKVAEPNTKRDHKPVRPRGNK